MLEDGFSQSIGDVVHSHWRSIIKGIFCDLHFIDLLIYFTGPKSVKILLSEEMEKPAQINLIKNENLLAHNQH